MRRKSRQGRVSENSLTIIAMGLQIQDTDKDLLGSQAL